MSRSPNLSAAALKIQLHQQEVASRLQLLKLECDSDDDSDREDDEVGKAELVQPSTLSRCSLYLNVV